MTHYFNEKAFNLEFSFLLSTVTTSLLKLGMSEQWVSGVKRDIEERIKAFTDTQIQRHVKEVVESIENSCYDDIGYNERIKDVRKELETIKHRYNLPTDPS